MSYLGRNIFCLINILIVLQNQLGIADFHPTPAHFCLSQGAVIITVLAHINIHPSSGQLSCVLAWHTGVYLYNTNSNVFIWFCFILTFSYTIEVYLVQRFYIPQIKIGL